MPEKSSRKTRKSTRKGRNPLPILFLGLGGVILIALALLLLSRNTPASPTPLPGAPNASRVTLAEAKTAHEDGSAIFLDVRTTESFQLKHITSAVSIPESELLSRFNELDKNAWIITYCT
jgi:hypothetical protein